MKLLSADTPFWQQVIQRAEGNLQTPKVSTTDGDIDYFGYQLSVHKYQLALYCKGIMPHRGWRLKSLKEYYGLKGRDKAKLLEQFNDIFEMYKNLIG